MFSGCTVGTVRMVFDPTEFVLNEVITRFAVEVINVVRSPMRRDNNQLVDENNTVTPVTGGTSTRFLFLLIDSLIIDFEGVPLISGRWRESGGRRVNLQSGHRTSSRFRGRRRLFSFRRRIAFLPTHLT